MELQWQHRAKAVAYIDLVLSVLGLICYVLLAAFVFNATLVLSSESQELQEEIPKNYLFQFSNLVLKEYGWIVWLCLGILTIEVAIELWAAILLLKATEMIYDPKQSLNRAITWRIVALVCLIIDVVLCGNLVIIGVVVAIIIRGTMVYIVSNFITELKQLASAAGGVAIYSPKPDTVVVSK